MGPLSDAPLTPFVTQGGGADPEMRPYAPRLADMQQDDAIAKYKAASRSFFADFFTGNYPERSPMYVTIFDRTVDASRHEGGPRANLYAKNAYLTLLASGGARLAWENQHKERFEEFFTGADVARRELGDRLHPDNVYKFTYDRYLQRFSFELTSEAEAIMVIFDSRF